MTLLLPDACSPMGLDQLQAELREGIGVVARPWVAPVELDPAEVLDADEPVLIGADQASRGTVVTVEGSAVEVFGDEHAFGEDVVDLHDRPIAVEALDHQMRNGRPG